MRALLSFVVVGILLFLPSFCSAQSLTALADKLLFQPDSNYYRLRQTNKPWQLVGLPANFQPEKYEVIDNQVFLLGQASGRKSVLSSRDGLRFTAVTELSGQELSLKKVGRFLVAGLVDSNITHFFVTDGASAWQPISDSLLPTINLIDRMLDVNGELTLVTQAVQTDISVYRQGNWTTVAVLPCSTSMLLAKPFAAVNCGDQLYYPALTDFWQPLFPQTVKTMAFDHHIIAQDLAAPSTFYVFDGASLLTIALTDFGDPQTVKLTTFGSRYFIRGSQLWELTPSSTPTLQSVDLNPNAILIPTTGADRLYLHQTGHEASSDAAGSWQPITIAGDYNQAQKTEIGWLLWKQNGNITQFAPVSAVAYQLINTSWAASSKIQELATLNGVTFLWLYNSSSKPNLYKTTDFNQWTRVTLPTNLTHVVTIAEARSLPVGSLVVVQGTISVPPGVVASDVLYLQDETGGIQIFLGASKGTLPNAIHHEAEAIGEISSSQVKRLTLDAPNDLGVGEPVSLTLLPSTPTEAITKLGQTFILKAKISAVGNDYLSLAATANLLRLRYKQLNTEYKIDDEGTFPAVVDFNSSSGLVDSWSLGGDALVSRPEPSAPTPPPVTEPPPTAQPTAEPPTLPSTQPITQTAATTTTTKKVARPTARVTNVSAVKVAPAEPVIPIETLVLPVQETIAPTAPSVPVTEALILSFLSLVAGILSLRGRRFRHLFEP